MSHVVSIETEIRDAQALCAACRRLGLAEPVYETVKLFNTNVAGHCVRLPNWRYPVACQLDAGTIVFDDFQGRWGKQQELERLIQGYAIEKTRIECHRQGYDLAETALSDGSVKLTVQIGGAT